MPLWVRAHAGVGASGRRHGQEWWGPYEDSRYTGIRSFARIGSQTGTQRDLIWEPPGCLSMRQMHTSRGAVTKVGECGAVRLRTYKRGERVFPVVMTPEVRQLEKQQVLSGRPRSLYHLKGY